MTTKPISSSGTADESKSRFVWRENYRKRTFVQQVRQISPKFEERFKEFLSWSQARKEFGSLVSAMNPRVQETPKKLMANVKFF